MKKGSKHINQKLNDSYPKPDVSADASWTKMNDMLNANIPTSNPGNWTKLFLSVSTTIVITVVSAYYFWPKQISESSIQKKPDNKQEESRPMPATNESQLTADDLYNGQDSVSGIKEDVQNINPNPISSEPTANSRALQRNDVTSVTSANPKGKNTISTKDKTVNSIKYSDVTGRNTDQMSESPTGAYETVPPRDLQTMDRQTAQESGRITRSETPASASNQVLNLKLLKNRNTYFRNSLSYPQIKGSSRNQKVKEDKPSGSLLRNTEIGLQWQTAIPLHSTKHFLKTGESNNVYQLLIPGISVSQKFGNRNHLRLTFLPFGQYFSKEILVSNSLTELPDSSTIVTNRTSLNKTRGWNAGISYERAVLKNFEIGAGIFIHKQSYALLSSETVTADDSTSSFQTELLNRKYTSADGFTKQYLFTANLEAFYTFHKMQFGTGIFIPLTSMSPTITTVRPVNGKVFIRWRLK